MATTKSTIDAMRRKEAELEGHGRSVDAAIMLKLAEMRNAGAPSCGIGRIQHRANQRQIAVWIAEADAARNELTRTTRRRKAAEVRLFAGKRVPSKPLDQLAMWGTLLIDRNELPDAYVGVAGRCTGDHLLQRVWSDNEEALLATEPTTVEAATAYYFAAKRDEEDGWGCGNWDPERVEQARKLAMPTLPRPR